MLDSDIQLNCRVFVWPRDMEVVIELAIQRLSMKRDQADAFVKNKRVLFDSKLKKHEKVLVVFKKRDPPILTMDEMQDAVDTIENIVARLEVKYIYMFQFNKWVLYNILGRQSRSGTNK
ncbi:hypothetical protein NQ314_005607 [Rhamnusium bicolor]|uniref:Uncharacterized protein n=1 Tax=Rhamnusium bicolor TaxID=1586634 RepID=A0AAV8ZFB5_9CUCU|nr:hypothetical protein NQ314_005607 [Rhamnusium bicolor]